jgi:NAD(P)H-quinone oxidoreductase subunit 5
LECGLGVFSAALLHIIAHSAYKAHAFLSSGETIKLAQTSKSLLQSPRESAYGIVLATFISLVTITLLGIVSGSNLITQPGPSTLSYIFALGLAIFLAHGFKGRINLTFLLRFFVSVTGIVLLFFATQKLATIAFYDSLPTLKQNLSALDLLFRVLLILLFSTLTMIPQIAPQSQSPRWLAFYIHLSHGFYINTFANRLAILFWPGAAPQSGTPTYIPNYKNEGDV